jgi:hypothetical protein
VLTSRSKVQGFKLQGSKEQPIPTGFPPITRILLESTEKYDLLAEKNIAISSYPNSSKFRVNTGPIH